MPELDAMLRDLETLVNVESPSRNLEALQRSAETLAALIAQRLGSPARLIPSAAGPHVHWQAGGKPKVLLLGHHDTVFPIGSLARRPFALSNGSITGPGVFDMKAGIVQAIHAVAGLSDREGMEMLFSADEEIGSDNSRELIEERAVACGSVLVLEPSADEGALKIARKGTGSFTLTIHGKAAHAGLEPHKGVNALIEAAHQVLFISTLGDPQMGTTVTPTVASAGTADNVVPALATVLVDVRVESAGEKERIETAMADLCAVDEKTRLEISGGIRRPPMPETASAELFPLATAAAREIGLGELLGVGVGGGSDGNFTAAIGVATLDGLGAVGGGAHADHEFVLVDTLVERARLLGALITRVQRR